MSRPLNKDDNSQQSTTYVHYLPEEHGETDYELLSQEEKQRAAGFILEQHRHLYVVAHVFLRKVLSYHTGRPPQDWSFHKNSHGKPFISNEEFKWLQFNLSHTQGIIACAVSHHDIGVDVEGSRPLRYLQQMSERNYTKEEYDDIFSSISPEKKLYRFYTYWTLKESLVKAIGCGLSMPLKKIGFMSLENNRWVLAPEVKLTDGELDHHWTFINKKTLNDYQISVAIKSTSKIDNNIHFINSSDTNSRHWQEFSTQNLG